LEVGVKSRIGALVAAGWLTTLGVVAYGAGGPKKTAETCAVDDDCSRGHCYTKQNGEKVCVDCSPSTINDYRGQIQRYCKDEPTSCERAPSTAEVPEAFYKIRLENVERCITARDRENRECWNGGDDGHKTALDQAERIRKNCYDDLNTRKGLGTIYTCSDSTYSSRASEVDSACTKQDASACNSWSKDDSIVSCSDIEDALKRVSRCVEAVDRLDSDCLDRLSRDRENQISDAKKGVDVCKDVLNYKKDKKLCK
jgi:hypothetical protein